VSFRIFVKVSYISKIFCFGRLTILALADNITSETYWYKKNGIVNDNSKGVEAKHLYCKKSSEGFKKMNFLNNFPMLETIDASACEISEINYDLHNDAELSFFPHKLHTLDLSHNKITYIRQYCFFSLQIGLKTLNLSNNVITDLATEAFYRLKVLEVLDLSNNRIAFINQSSFNDLGKLEKFNFARNRFQILDFSLFSKSPHLLTMNFSLNQINRATFSTSIRWNYLTTLDLSNNKIYQIGTYIKSQRFPNLKDLILSEAPMKPDSSSTSSNQHNNITQDSQLAKTDYEEVVKMKSKRTEIFLILYITIITILILFIVFQLDCTSKRANIVNCNQTASQPCIPNVGRVEINPIYAHMDEI
jgi:Leucine-rich repeat (LRR) protein